MEDNPELNAFRRQWREEVIRRSKTGSTSKQQQHSSVQNAVSESSSHLEHLPPKHEAAGRKDDGEEDFGQDYGEFVQRTESLTLRTADEDTFQRLPQTEPRSALEHFEKAVEKEAEGSLGDSLAHYRKAYRVGALFIWKISLTIILIWIVFSVGRRNRSEISQEALFCQANRGSNYKIIGARKRENRRN